MKILATADLHGNLPEVPPCDLFLIAGDVCPIWNHELDFQLRWLDGPFRSWLAGVEAEKVVGIAGNHDFIFEQHDIDGLHLPWTYLLDTMTIYDGLKIYGTPWVPNLPAWAFHKPKAGLKLRYDAIPKGTDIVLSHGPPFGYGDKVCYQKPNEATPHVGCRSATDMTARIKPKAYVTGHIHEAFGHYRLAGRNFVTQVYNCSYVDETYAAVHPIVQIDLTDDVMIDAIEEQTDIERQIRSGDTNSRPSQEFAEGSDSRELAMAAV